MSNYKFELYDNETEFKLCRLAPFNLKVPTYLGRRKMKLRRRGNLKSCSGSAGALRDDAINIILMQINRKKSNSRSTLSTFYEKL